MSLHFYHKTTPVTLTVNSRTRRFNGVTFCWRYKKDEQRLEYSMSLCSPRDQFNRKIGRKVAEGRFRKGIRGDFYLKYLGEHDCPKWSEIIDRLLVEFTVADVS